MIEQLNTWQGDFGKAYTDRNAVEWKKRQPAFQNMIGDLDIHKILEVGCNRGHNLITLSQIIQNNPELVGLEPNPYALDIARQTSTQIGVLQGNAYDQPFKDDYFDLVFTANVLIHIPLENLSAVLGEIYRVSKRYILAVEYYAEEETVIHYRGHDNLLWKRNFLKHYQDQFPTLKLVKSGYWSDEDGFDRSHWWLLEK